MVHRGRGTGGGPGRRKPVCHSSASEAADLSPGVFNYVVNSRKAVVLENACRDSQFGGEKYLNEHRVRSVLCLPICYKGELDLVIYLENNLAEGAFTDNRLEFLQLLSGHMAISFENALMYENLRASMVERERAEQTLKESEERLRLVLEGTTDGIWDWNVLTGEAYLSPRYYTMMGYAPGELAPRFESWRDRVHPDDLEKVMRIINRGMQTRTGLPVNTGSRQRTANGAGSLGAARSQGTTLKAKPSA